MGNPVTSDSYSEVLAKRRDRALAVILGIKEREVDSFIPRSVSVKLRKVILDQVNDLVALAEDLMSALDDDSSVLNEIWLTRIEEIHAATVGNGNR